MMGVFIGFLLSLFVLFQVQAGDLNTTSNQVYWNDSRILYSSPRTALWDVDWEIYNMTVGMTSGESRAVATWICNTGAMNMWSKDDCASLIFNGKNELSSPKFESERLILNLINFQGTSVTVNFLSSYILGIRDMIVLVDDVPWTTLNTTNTDALAGMVAGSPVNCVIASVTKSGLSSEVHNVTVVVPTTDLLRAYEKLFLSFEYTARPEDIASTSSKVAPGPVIGGTLVGLFGILNITLFIGSSYDEGETLALSMLNRSATSMTLARITLSRPLRNYHRRLSQCEKARLQSPLNPPIVNLRHASALENPEPVGNERPNDGGESSRLAVIQELLDRGVPSSEIAAVIQRMQEEAGSMLPLTSRDETRATSPPPEYDIREKFRVAR
ncbi:hypothetical protein FRB93_005306 [Tulasnella sp. JGI-2019a]|nr:hypothetical protein FRB93_005306 [Tulasnella sp. JGI-2019a]